MTHQNLKFYGHPRSRARTIYWMLQEAGCPYELVTVDLKSKQQKSPAFLDINSLGKIPAIVHKGVTVTESAAICAYLADAFPDMKLAPLPTSPQRGSYFRWFFFMASCFEPAILDKMMNVERTPEMSSYLGYAPIPEVLKTLESGLNPGPFLLGDQFTSVDVYTASQLWWASCEGMITLSKVLDNYLKACQERPAYKDSLKILGQLEAML